MSEIDEWIALGDPAERHLALAAYDAGEQRLEGYQDTGWPAVARFQLVSALGDASLTGEFRLWLFGELDQFRAELSELQRTLTTRASLRTAGGELELSFAPHGSRGGIKADIALRKIGMDPFEAQFDYAFDQSHLTRILRDLNRQFPKAVQ